MSDIFHKDVSFSFVDTIIKTILLTPQHQYQLLTKRVECMAKYFERRDVPSNVWLGVTVESKSVKNRIGVLRGIEAPVHFLSCEPLLEDFDRLILTILIG
jgi:protein gp37